MNFSVDPSRLRDHIDFLRQELLLSQQLLEALERQKRLELETGGAVSTRCSCHIQFAREFQERTRERRMLLEAALDLLADAEWKMEEAVADSVEQLDAGSIAAAYESCVDEMRKHG